MYINGQANGFSGYGGIKDLAEYINANYGLGWTEVETTLIKGIEGFTQSEFEKDSNNCTLASITRIMKYYSDIGYTNIPQATDQIYTTVREIGIKHGYDPKKSGIFRDLFVYSPWEIDNIVRNTWKAFGYSNGNASNCYIGKWTIIKSSITNLNPLLFNIAFGDYKNHTVSIVGYRVFRQRGGKGITFLQIFDGWSETVSYIDLKKFGFTPSSVTRILPPL